MTCMMSLLIVHALIMSSWFVFPTAYECNADLKPNSIYYPQGVVKLDLLILTPVA